MIHAIVLAIVVAQIGTAVTAAPRTTPPAAPAVSKYTAIVLEVGKPLVLVPGQPWILSVADAPGDSIKRDSAAGEHKLATRREAHAAVLPMIQTIVLAIVLHAQMVLPIVGSPQGGAASAPTSVLPVLILSDVFLIPADQVEVLP